MQTVTTPNPSKSWLSVAQAAERLGVTVQTIHDRIKAGKLRAARVGALTLVLRADVEKAER